MLSSTTNSAFSGYCPTTISSTSSQVSSLITSFCFKIEFEIRKSGLIFFSNRNSKHELDKSQIYQGLKQFLYFYSLRLNDLIVIDIF